MDRLSPLVSDSRSFRLCALAALFRRREDYEREGCGGAAAAAADRYSAALARRKRSHSKAPAASGPDLLRALEEAWPDVEELAGIVRFMATTMMQQKQQQQGGGGGGGHAGEAAS